MSCPDEVCGIGYCDNVTLNCVCPYPYTNIGDFAIEQNVGCDVNIIASQILWGICSAIWFVFVILSVCLVIYFQIHSDVLSPRMKMDQKILVYKSIIAILMGTVGLLEISSPLNRIGIDVTTTYLFCAGATGFWFDLVLFFFLETSTNILILAMKNSTTLTRTYTRVYPIFILMAVVGTLAPLGLLYEPRLALVWIYLHFVLLGILLLVLLIVFLHAMNVILLHVRHALISTTAVGANVNTNPGENNGSNEGSAGSRREVLRNKLVYVDQHVRKLRKDGGIQLVTSPLTFVFGTVPFLIRRNSYWIPIVWGIGGSNWILFTLQLLGAIKSQLNERIISSHSLGGKEPGSYENVVSSGAAPDTVPPISGLGIKRKPKKPKWGQKMSRITEITEMSSQGGQI